MPGRNLHSGFGGVGAAGGVGSVLSSEMLGWGHFKSEQTGKTRNGMRKSDREEGWERVLPLCHRVISL